MTIKEVAEKFGLTNDTLRYYEKVGLIGPVKKNKSGIRDYNEADLKRIEFIKCMRSAGLPIEVLKKYVDLFDEGADTVGERRKLLEDQRDILKEKIDKMNEAYDRLNYKIKMYNENKLEDLLKEGKQ